MVKESLTKGWSQKGQRPRTVNAIVTELGLLLQAANITDVLFVGHSLAGYTVKLAFATLTQLKIHAVVLADPIETTTIARWTVCKTGTTYNAGVAVSVRLMW